MKASKLFTTILTLVLALGMARAEDTWTITNSGSTFTISRTESTYARTVLYRTVSLSAFSGQHFIPVSGSLTFAAGESSKSITVTECDPGVDAFKFQINSSRKYRFELTDRVGFLLASRDRYITTGTSVPQEAFAEKSITIKTEETRVTDAGYINNPYLTMSASSYYDVAAPKGFYSLVRARLEMTISFVAREVDDGYQYVQILFDNTTSCDSGCDDGYPGNINLSHYLAGFGHHEGYKRVDEIAYTFPLTSLGDDCDKVENPWNSHPYSPVLYKQKFNFKTRADSGRLIVPNDFTTLVLRLNASGKDDDDWICRNVLAHIQPVDCFAPTRLGGIQVSPGSHRKNNTVYISIPFNEIVFLQSTSSRITSSWGDFTYESGNDSNVLTFKGRIPSDASGPLNITGFIGEIYDMAGNTFEGSISANELCTLDSDLAYDLADFERDGEDYLITCCDDMRGLAGYLDAGNSSAGLTFKMVKDIEFAHTSTWDDASSTENNYQVIGSYNKDFKGTFDGQGHTVSGVRIYNPNNMRTGLFGSLAGTATVTNLKLTDTRIAGAYHTGGIVGLLGLGTRVADCMVASDVCLQAAIQGSLNEFGGVVGNCEGLVERCVSSVTLDIAGGNAAASSFGGIAGNIESGTVSNCLVIGAHISQVNEYGAIAGHLYNHVISSNFYRACNIAGVENAVGVGCSGADVSASNGAMPVYSLTWPNDIEPVLPHIDVLPGNVNRICAVGAYIGGVLHYAPSSTVTLYRAVPYARTILLSLNGTPFTDNGDDTFTATMPAQDATVTVQWSVLPELNIALSPATLMGSPCYIASFYAGEVNVQLPEGASAYTVVREDDVFVFLLLGEDGRIVPKNTPVIIIADRMNLSLTTLDTVPAIQVVGNILIGTDYTETYYYNKVLVLGVIEGEAGFYYWSKIGIIPAGKAFIAE